MRSRNAAGSTPAHATMKNPKSLKIVGCVDGNAVSKEFIRQRIKEVRLLVEQKCGKPVEVVEEENRVLYYVHGVLRGRFTIA